MTFSIYSLLLFGDLCHPVEGKMGENHNSETFHWRKEISCKKFTIVKEYWNKHPTHYTQLRCADLNKSEGDRFLSQIEMQHITINRRSNRSES